ncbi:MAG: DUF2231 domain-containing protein [Acidimicrobiales bacterium]
MNDRSPLSSAATGAPSWLRAGITRIEQDDRLDRLSALLRPAADAIERSGRAELLRGHRLGHALHPALTDVPLGCWLSAGLLDVVGGRRSQPAARRLIGIGLLATAPTALTGLAEWAGLRDPRLRRVGAAHAAANAAVSVLYLRSWSARRRGQRLRGVALSLGGAALAAASGHLGGHLSYARGVGVGPRGLDERGPLAPAPEPGANVGEAATELVSEREASELLGVPLEQIDALVSGRLLAPAEATGNGRRCRRVEVLAVRQEGG